MASRCSRIISRAYISSIRSSIKLNSQSASSTTSFSSFSASTRSASSPLRRLSFSRYFGAQLIDWTIVLLFSCLLIFIISYFQSCFYIYVIHLCRIPSELGGVQSMLPLHNAVATARMTSCLSSTSRSCRALSQGTLCCTSPDLQHVHLLLPQNKKEVCACSYCLYMIVNLSFYCAICFCGCYNWRFKTGSFRGGRGEFLNA